MSRRLQYLMVSKVPGSFPILFKFCVYKVNSSTSFPFLYSGQKSCVGNVVRTVLRRYALILSKFRTCSFSCPADCSAINITWWLLKK